MSLMFLLFGFMLLSLGLGLLLGWLIWRYENGVAGSLSTKDTEIEFWRKNLTQCRLELGNEKDAAELLREEHEKLKTRIKELEKMPKE